MAWTAPMTFVANTVLTADMLNTYLTNNLLETETAKATSSGSWFIGDGPNKIVERIPQFANISAAEDRAAAMSYGDLETVGPTVTVTTGSRAIIMMSASLVNHTGANTTLMTYQVSGATTIAASDNRALIVDGVTADMNNQRGQIMFEETLNPGENTFTLKYQAPNNPATISNRFIGVWPL